MFSSSILTSFTNYIHKSCSFFSNYYWRQGILNFGIFGKGSKTLSLLALASVMSMVLQFFLLPFLNLLVFFLLSQFFPFFWSFSLPPSFSHCFLSTLYCESEKMLGKKKFLDQTKFFNQKEFGLTKFWSKKLLGQKVRNFAWKAIGSKKILVNKNFGDAPARINIR